MMLCRRLTATTENLVKILLPVIVKHLVSLIDDHELQATKSQILRAIHEVQKTTRRGNQDVAALAELIDLVTDGATTVNNTGPQHAPVTELASLHEDLDRELTCGHHDANQGLGTSRLIDTRPKRGRVGTRRGELLRFSHELVQNGNEIGCGLARTLELCQPLVLVRDDESGSYQFERCR